MTDEHPDDGPPTTGGPSSVDGPPDWQPPVPPYAAPPGWQPPPPPYAAPPGWQPPPAPYGAPPAGWQPPVPPYGAPPGWHPGGYPQPRTTNGFAIAALVCALVGVVLPFVGGILGVVFGLIALKQTRDGRESGRGLAIAGIVIGSLVLVLDVVGVVAILTGTDDSTTSPSFPSTSYMLSA